MTCSLRTLWLSDIHLGTPACRSSDLAKFLLNVRAERIYLTGDIIDLERLKQKPVFPEHHWQIVTQFMHLARSGTEILYIPGNHDFQFRELAGQTICGVRIALEAMHTTAANERLLTVHGDCLDSQTRAGTSLEQFGAAAYRWLVDADAKINQIRGKLGRDYAPIASRIKLRLKAANQYIERFEQTAARYARARGADGIVCGHIHKPALRILDGVRYANDGDWVEHRTAVAEDMNGKLQLLSWHSGSLHTLEKDDDEALAA